jgi:hypothetical protein
MAKALLIDPEAQSIEPVDVSGESDIKALVGFETLESDKVGEAGDKLYFDEECFIRGTPGRFQIDAVIPVAGKGVVVGVDADGSSLVDVSMDIEDLRRRTVFR